MLIKVLTFFELVEEEGVNVYKPALLALVDGYAIDAAPTDLENNNFGIATVEVDQSGLDVILADTEHQDSIVWPEEERTSTEAMFVRRGFTSGQATTMQSMGADDVVAHINGIALSV